MPTYISLLRLTGQGAKAIKDSPKRRDAAAKAIESLGGKLVHTYLTMGRYDFVAIIEAPDDEAAANPSISAQSPTPTPGVRTIPSCATAISTLEPTKPIFPVRRRCQMATVGAVSSCAPFSASRVGEIRLWRPVWSRKSGMYALLPK